MKKNIAANGIKNITVIAKAISDVPGNAKFFGRGVHGSLGSDAIHRGDENNSFSVAMIRLDDYFRSDAKIDVIKMDIIGSEMKALCGMKELLARNPHISILSAFCPDFLRNAGTSAEEYLNELHRLGFTVYEIPKGKGGATIRIDPSEFRALTRSYDPQGGIAQTELLCVR